MKERPGAVTLHGNPLTLVGDEAAVGAKAPAFSVLTNDMKPATLADFTGKVLILTTVPSLDTPVCDTEVRRFNKEATGLGASVRVLTVSMDLPFAQKRWCGAAGITNVVTLSDHRDASLGMAYGLLIKELRLLARAVVVVDREGVIRYREVVHEVGDEPAYDEALRVVRSLV